MTVAAASARSRACGLSTSSTALQSRARSANISRSAAGMPSSSPTTATGTGNANPVTKSLSPAICPQASATIRSTAGRSPATRRAVRQAETRRRSRVWAGGLSIMMLPNISRRAGRSCHCG